MPKLDLPERYRRQLLSLLETYVPEAEVWAYGSRVRGTNHEASDLDIVLRGPQLAKLGYEYSELVEAVRESTIPILIDIFDWARLPESFHREIERNYVVLKESRPWREPQILDEQGHPTAIDIDPSDRKTVLQIVERHVPNCEVRAYGPRVEWTAELYSRLDIAVMDTSEVGPRALTALREAFSNSALPFIVEVVDGNSVPEETRVANLRKYVVLQLASNQQRWRKTTVGEFAPLTYGKSLPARDRTAGGLVPVYGSNGVIGTHSASLTNGPTVVVGRKGSVGAVHYSQRPCWPIDTTFYLQDSDSMLARFKCYALSAIGLEEMNTDSAVPGLNRDTAHACQIRVPSEAGQRAIAAVLGTLDDRIELNRRMCATLEEMASALFKAWFVDFEPVQAKMEGRWREGESLPGLPAHLYDLFPDELTDSELGPIPAGWRPCSLGDVIRIHDSRRVPLSRRERQQRKGPFRYYGATGIVDYVDDFLFDGRFVLVGEDGTVVNDDGAPVVQYVWGRFWVNNHAHVLSSAGGISAEHLQLLLRSVNIRPFVTGAVQLKLNQRNLKSIPILTSSDGTVTAFEDIVAPQFAALRQAHDELHLLVALRDLLLPKLISGAVRLSDTTGVPDC